MLLVQHWNRRDSVAVGGSGKSRGLSQTQAKAGHKSASGRSFQKDGEGLTRHSYCEINSRMPLAPWARFRGQFPSPPEDNSLAFSHANFRIADNPVIARSRVLEVFLVPIVEAAILIGHQQSIVV